MSRSHLTSYTWARHVEDPYLRGALAYAYHYAEEWKAPADMAGLRRVSVRWGNLPNGINGQFNPRGNSIIMSNVLKSESTSVMAAILAHEGFHASHYTANDAGDCFQEEINAFRWQAYVWMKVPRGYSRSNQERFNDLIARAWRSSNDELIDAVVTSVALH